MKALAGNPVRMEAVKTIGLFRGKANCTACHLGPTFSDEAFHNTGVAVRDGRLQDLKVVRLLELVDQKQGSRIRLLEDVR